MRPRFYRGSMAQQTDQVLNLLNQGTPMSVQEIMDELSLPKNNILASLERLEQQKEVYRKQGRYQVILQKTDG